MKNESTSKLEMITSMVIFGTIGIFVRYISLPSSVIALVRGIIGTIFLIGVMFVKKQRPELANIKTKIIRLIISGACIGVNWILLFESYRYVSVATATLCYYMSPIIVIILSPLFFKEKLTPIKIVCTIAAIIGMVFVSGIIKDGLPKIGEIRGIILALAAAVLYASVIIINKKMGDISSYDRTVTQLFFASVILLPYCLITENFGSFNVNRFQVMMLILVGVIHTGIAYWMYFSSINGLKSQTVAILGYIDPVVAVILSALLLHEHLDIFGIVGALLILGATFFSDYDFKKSNKEQE